MDCDKFCDDVMEQYKERIYELKKKRDKIKDKNSFLYILYDETLKKQDNNNYKDFIRTSAKNAYCNKTDYCKDTLFEIGDDKVIIKKMLLQMPYLPKDKQKLKKVVESIVALRKSLYDKNKQILKNGFYNKLTEDDIKMMKEKGAISGCSLINPLKNKKTIKAKIKNIFSNLMHKIGNKNDKLIKSSLQKSIKKYSKNSH